MKKIFWLLIAICFNVFAADQVDIRLIPENPIMNENFLVVFDVTTDDEYEPDINFDPFGIEVLSKTEAEVSTQTTYMNGRLSVKRKISVGFNVIAPNSGIAYVRNIKVHIGQRKLTHPGVQIQILKIAQKPSDVFVVAEVDKEMAYVGESILLRYYLYDRVMVHNVDIKKFPSLDKFLKRFHQESNNGERVQYQGDIFIRRVIYTSQLFAEKPGKYKIDPIELVVKYSNERQNPFAGFGLGMGTGRVQTKNLTSKAKEVQILPIPTEGLPSGYTGLVGKHDVDFKITKNKFLVNEPIEISLVVNGNGALELFDVSNILNSSELEEFETNADLQVKQDFSASKKFAITYLGRGPLTIPAQIKKMSFFDPDSKKFVHKDINIPEIIIEGNGLAESKGDNVNETPSMKESVIPEFNKPSENYIPKPIYSMANTYVYNSTTINIIIAVIIAILLTFVSTTYFRSNINISEIFDSIFKSNHYDYSSLFLLLSQLKGSGDIENKLRQSNISPDARDYFIRVMNELNMSFKNNENNKKINVKRGFLKEILNVINKDV